MSKNKISLIIPAYNESKNISRVLGFVKGIEMFDEILVIDDGSDDNTCEIVKKFSGIKLLEIPENVGKTKAVLKGVKEAKYDDFMLLDADLFGLTRESIEEVIDTYNEGFDMVILDYGGQEYFLKYVVKSFPALSGIRMLNRKEFNKIEFKTTDRFELENRINTHFLENKLDIIVVANDSIFTPHKHKKYSLHKSVMLHAKALNEMILSDGVVNIPKTVRQWWEIHDKKKQ